MTAPASGVTDRRPSDGVVRVLNPMMRGLLRSPLGRVIGGLALVQFDGRRSGRRYRVVVAWHELDGEVVVFTPAAWRANFAGGADAIVLHRGHRRRLTGTLDADPAAVATVLGSLIESGAPARSFGLGVPSGHVLTAADVVAVDRAMIRFPV